LTPGTKVSLDNILEQRHLQLRLHQQLVEAGVLLLQLGHPFGFRGLIPAALLKPTVVGRALADQLFGCLELADDLLGCVHGAFHGRAPGPVWPDDEVSHSVWTRFRGPGKPVPN